MDTQEEATMGVMERWQRSAFRKEFKAETAVIEGRQSIPEVARDLQLTESALHHLRAPTEWNCLSCGSVWD